MQSTLLSRSSEESERGSNARSRSEAAAAAAGSAALLFLLTRRDLTGLTIKTNVAMSWRWRYVWRLKNKTHTHTHALREAAAEKAGLLFFVELLLASILWAWLSLAQAGNKTEKKNTIKMLICMLCLFSASFSCLTVCRLTRASNVQMLMMMMAC